MLKQAKFVIELIKMVLFIATIGKLDFAAEDLIENITALIR